MAALVGGIILLVIAVPEIERAFRHTPWDLNVDYLSARAYLAHYSPFTAEGARRSGVTIAGPSGLGHPPTTAFWALPLASLEIHTAGKVLGGLTLVLILVELVAIIRLLRFPAPLPTAWLATTYIVGCSFMSYHLGVGQISGLIGFLIFAAWWAGRTGRDFIAGAALGAACTLKLFPAVLVLFFLLTRRWRAVGAALVVYLMVAAIMTARFGVDSWGKFFSMQAVIADLWMGDVQNQSLHGIVSRIFEPVCVPHGPVIRNAMLISSAVSMILLGLATRLLWRSPSRSNTFDRFFALFTTLAVVMSQWVWEHYTIIYVLPLLVLAAQLRERWQTHGRGRVVTAAMILASAGIVASWRVDLHLKQNLQRAVQQGRLASHLRLHVFDVLNWAPGVILLGLLFIAVSLDSRPAPRRPGASAGPSPPAPGGATSSIASA